MLAVEFSMDSGLTWATATSFTIADLLDSRFIRYNVNFAASGTTLVRIK
jgi:hypothetical protein